MISLLNQIAAAVAGETIWGEVMAETNVERSITPRSTGTTREAAPVSAAQAQPQQRGVVNQPTVRGATQSRGTINAADVAPVASPAIPAFNQDALSRILINAGLPVADDFRKRLFPDNTVDAEIDTTNKSDTPTTLYGTDDPFSILADYAARTFGLEGDNTPQTQYVPVSGASSGGGGNGGMIVLVLLIAAGAAYYFFVVRKKASA